VDVAVAEGPQGPQLWALRANGGLDLLAYNPAQEGPEASLKLQESLNGFNNFDRIGAADLNGDRMSERLLYKAGEDSLVVENAETGLVSLFLAVPSGVGEVRSADLNQDGRPELLVGQRGDGLKVLNADGSLRWLGPATDLRSFAVADVHASAGLEVIQPGAEGQLWIYSQDGKLLNTLDARGRADRVLVHRSARNAPPQLVVRDTSLSRVVAADLDGDGRQELAGVTGSGNLFLFSSDGNLLSRVSFKGDRLSLAAGDLNLDGRDELVVGGEGLGVVVLGGGKLPAPPAR
jgi:hypothetical protein